MVQPRRNAALYFLAFVLPALLLYALFFLYPFVQGLAISFTNWDGLTPRTPISLPRAEFEARILSHLAPGDRDFLLGIYRLDAVDGLYKRYSISGLDRYRLQAVLRRVGYQPDGYRRVGLDNYLRIFRGEVEERFYPYRFTKTNYNEDSDLPAEIPAAEFDGNFLPHLEAESERGLALDFYAPEGAVYRLRRQYDGFTIEDAVWLLPEVDRDRTVASAAVDALLSSVKAAGLASDGAASTAAVDAFLKANRISAPGRETVRDAAGRIYRSGAMKRLLASRWTERRFEMGVIGFTLFFTFFNVVGSNLIAFFLALALERGAATQKVLRSVFFLPNVLSMVVVALVWSFVFFSLLPKLTGIPLWMGDAAKAPWLVVMVQIWQQSGYLMVIYLAGMSNIPTDVLEAAHIDGVRFWGRLRSITLPLLLPAFTICLFLSLSNSLKSFDLVYALQGPSGYATGTVPFVMDIYFDAFAKKQAGLATAKATLLFLAIALITGIQLTIGKRREVQL